MGLRTSRRSLVITGARTAALFPFATWLEATAQRTPQPIPSPNAPTNPNAPAGFENYPEPKPRAQGSTVNPEQLHAMVQQLYGMALDLKEESDKTNLKDTLPADFLKKAQQIEKLAKSIKDRARG